MATRLTASQISDLDPYKFMAAIGKRVIHPGGQASTQALLRGRAFWIYLKSTLAAAMWTLLTVSISYWS